jgi:hypothetical protein
MLAGSWVVVFPLTRKAILNIGDDHRRSGLMGEEVRRAKAQIWRPALFVVREQMAGLADDQQNHEQGGDQNDMRRSVHVVQHVIDFFHVCLLRAGVKLGSIVGRLEKN